MRNYGGVVLSAAFRIMLPFSLIFGVYILTHGEFSPGGGFQAGSLLAIGFVMARFIDGQKAAFNISGETAVILAGMGTFIYVLAGYLPLFAGAQFLDYSFLPFGGEHLAERHAAGILMIEIGVTICVMMTILNILDAIMERVEDE